MVDLTNVILRLDRSISHPFIKILRSSRRMAIWAVWIASLTLAMTVHAQEDTSSTYAPEFCDFSVTFPKEPYITRKCEDADKARCFDQVSYTQVYDLASTVNFRVICNPIKGEVFKAYTPEVMAATLRAMTRGSVVKQFDSSFREEETFKQAGLVGEGMSGRTPTIYLAQLWIGQNSALSVEAELIGEAYEDADALFSNVLKSIGLKQAEVEAEEDEDSDDEDKDEKDDKKDQDE